MTAAPFVRPACSELATPAYDFSNVPDAPTVILSADQNVITATLSVCEITGYISPQEQFRLELPVNNYSGIYMQKGCGSFCGLQIEAPPNGGGKGASTPDTTATTNSERSNPANPSCAEQTAELAAARSTDVGAHGTATTDTQPEVTDAVPATGTDNEGHRGADGDALWAKDDPALRVSFGYTSEHALAQAAKAIIAAYYGSPPRYTFFDGCSGGGREALVEAQRYPKDFNGILAGAPGNIEAQLLGVVAPWVIDINTDRHGHEILTSEKLPALNAAVTHACGNSNGLIEDPRSCHFNPASIQCAPGTDANSCLTPAQVRVAQEFYRGPNDGRGHSFYPGGIPYGSELAWNAAAIDPSTDQNWPRDTHAYKDANNYLKYAAYWTNPPSSFGVQNVQFTVDSYNKLLPLAGIYNATDPDLSAFADAGGKIIIYQGWADQLISPFGTVDYYQSVVQRSGGFAASQQFSRLYMVPGQFHCLVAGQPGLQNGAGAAGNVLLPALQDWVINGTAPGTVSFPLAQPTHTLSAITVSPLDPSTPSAGGTRGLNTQDDWIGKFQPGHELWCSTNGMNLDCDHKVPSISYSTGPSARVG